MASLNFEKNLEHQNKAVESTISIFDNLEIQHSNGLEKEYINPVILNNTRDYISNIIKIRLENNVITGKANSESNVIDIMMETGTGKTYTYAKTIFELNKQYGIFKFVIVVPTLSIKAGTIDFLKSESSREHFKDQYSKTLNLHIVESQKANKNKKSNLPSSIKNYVNSESFDKNNIQVMIINSGMINSDTMQKEYDSGLFDKYSIPFDAIAATNPFIIVDEPHKFPPGKKHGIIYKK